jgi:very-short-patch-repair endonuclease
MTDDERRLWRELRNRNFGRVKFRRQQPIGPYIVDFVSFEAKLIIELDGTQHAEKDHRSADEVRTRFLEMEGFRVVRYWNTEVFKEFDAVLNSIYHELGLDRPRDS